MPKSEPAAQPDVAAVRPPTTGPVFSMHDLSAWLASTVGGSNSTVLALGHPPPPPSYTYIVTTAVLNPFPHHITTAHVVAIFNRVLFQRQLSFLGSF